MKYGAEMVSARKLARIHANPKLRPNYQPKRWEVLLVLSIALLVGALIGLQIDV